MTKNYLGQTKVFDIQGEKITIGSYTYAIQKEITQLVNDNKLMDAMDRFLENSIKDWTLTGEDGKKLLIKKEIIDTLSGAFVNLLLAEATKFNNLAPEEVKNLGGRSEPQPRKLD